MEKPYILFDPNQYQEFGLKFDEQQGFYLRYQYSKKLFWNSIYIPYGPNIEDEKGLENFLNYIKTKKRSRVRIDLPLILDSNLKEKVKTSLTEIGFTEKQYIQDEETILIDKSNASFENKEIRYYVRKADLNYEFKVEKNLDKSVIDEIYALYVDSAARIGYKPKSLEVFERLNDNCLVGIARSRQTGKIDGFVYGYIYDLYDDYELKTTKKVLEIVFIGTNEDARKSYVGYGMHQSLFKAAFEIEGIDIINFRGASRTHDRKYLAFKKSFGGVFYPFAGSFEKVNLL
jgi:hypothetical protein